MERGHVVRWRLIGTWSCCEVATDGTWSCCEVATDWNVNGSAIFNVGT